MKFTISVDAAEQVLSLSGAAEVKEFVHQEFASGDPINGSESSAVHGADSSPPPSDV